MELGSYERVPSSDWVPTAKKKSIAENKRTKMKQNHQKAKTIVFDYHFCMTGTFLDDYHISGG